MSNIKSRANSISWNILKASIQRNNLENIDISKMFLPNGQIIAKYASLLHGGISLNDIKELPKIEWAFIY